MNKLPPNILEYIALFNIPVYHLLINSIPKLIHKQGLHKRAIDRFTVKKIDDYSTQIWTLNGVIHREDGPALIWSDCDVVWYLNGELHREDGPAVIYSNGEKQWYLNGELHRVDGPAVIYTDGYEEYWLNGVKQKNNKGFYE